MNTDPTALARRGPNRRKAVILFLSLAFVVCAGILGFRVSEHFSLASLRAKVGNELDLLAAAIDGSVTRLAPIPSVVELNGDVIHLLRVGATEHPSLQDTTNRFLEKLNARIDGLAVFVLDTHGIVVASSDWIYSDNLLGKNLTYRPFFQAAVSGTPYRQFAIDPARDEPGYFFAHPIRDENQDWKVIGVAVVKVAPPRRSASF